MEPWPLRSITIRLDMEPKHSEEPVSSSHCMNREGAIAPHILALPIRKAYEAGLLPELEQARIITRVGSSPHLHTARGTKHSGFAVYDMVHNRHIIIPVLAIETEFTTHSPSEYGALGKWRDLFLIRDEDGIDRYASWHLLMHFLEGNGTFRDTIAGRTPTDTDLSDLPGRSLVNLPKNVRVALWIREAKTGQPLLMARRMNGLHMTPANIAEIIPGGWKYGSTNKKGERQIVRDDNE